MKDGWTKVELKVEKMKAMQMNKMREGLGPMIRGLNSELDSKFELEEVKEEERKNGKREGRERRGKEKEKEREGRKIGVHEGEDVTQKGSSYCRMEVCRVHVYGLQYSVSQ